MFPIRNKGRKSLPKNPPLRTASSQYVCSPDRVFLFGTVETVYCFRSIALSVWSKSPCWHCSHHTRCSLVIFLALSYGRWWRTKLRHAAGLLSVALLPVGDLLLRAKHLFIDARRRQPRHARARQRAPSALAGYTVAVAPKAARSQPPWRRRTNVWRKATSPARGK